MKPAVGQLVDTNFDEMFGGMDETFSFNGLSGTSQTDPRDTEIEMLKAEIAKLKAEIEIMQSEVCTCLSFCLRMFLYVGKKCATVGRGQLGVETRNSGPNPNTDVPSQVRVLGRVLWHFHYSAEY